jgi:tannase/feruloyl esterase/3HB-oligomer hydrolase 3HBOH
MTEKGAKVRQHLVCGAEFDCEYLADLTTAGIRGTEYTNLIDWDGLIPLHAKDTDGPTKNVPGLQIDGYFFDDASQTTLAPNNFFGSFFGNKKKYPYDSQFVIRLPNPGLWNGKLVITGAPGVRGQYANDFIIGDFVLEKGYAFASTDKGNSGTRFYSADQRLGEAVAEWHRRVNQLTEAAKDAAEKYYGQKPSRTYITGTSNAGYLTRYALENYPELYDGGVDWQGVLWLPKPEGPNLLTFLPTAIKNYPRYIDPSISDTGRDDARDKMIDAGFPGKKEADSREKEFFDALWEYHYKNYWNSTQRSFREEFDPYYAGADADYNYAERINPEKNPLGKLFADAIKDAVAKVSLTGNIGKPLITVHGTLDTLLPITQTSGKYAELVKDVGKSHLHRYYTIEGGTHIDSLYDHYPDQLRPILPCYRAAFERLIEWVEEEKPPPEIETVQKPEGGSEDVVNDCSLLEC